MPSEAQRLMSREREFESSRAPKEYWDSVWQEGHLPGAVNPRERSLKHYVDLKFDALFREVFLPEKESGAAITLAELGCARSAWLPYFSKEFRFTVTGIDYSPLGCAQAKAILDNEGVEGEIVFADIFQPPHDLLDHFDYVVSFGVVEHFEATRECLRACAAFLRPGGRMVTIIPNMNGLVGWFQKSLAREVYDVHVPLDTLSLRREHEAAALDVLRCDYFCFLNFGVLNLNRIRQSFLGLLLSRTLTAISRVTWMLERIGIKLPGNKITSPYVVCVSRKMP